MASHDDDDHELPPWLDGFLYGAGMGLFGIILCCTFHDKWMVLWALIGQISTLLLVGLIILVSIA
jgi:hypothetical protein